MSDLIKSFAKQKLSSLPPEPPLHEDTTLPDADSTDPTSDSSSASSMSSTGTVIPSTTTKAKSPAPIPWTDFFAQELYLETALPDSHSDAPGQAKYHIYLTPPATPKDPLIICHHGAGSSGLTFALFALELRRLQPTWGILSVEARDHGSVVYTSSGDVDTDLSVETLSRDFLRMIALTRRKMGWAKLPQVVLVGHSLGGAVVAHTAATMSNTPAMKELEASSDLDLELAKHIIGFTVIDVVEGSAMDALKSMQAYLLTRPKTFPNLDAAVDWHVRSRTLRNVQSARASVPPLLVQMPGGSWVWRTDLSRTEQYWEDWFGGMSGKFLRGRGAKLLLLAGTDRLDKELMIGQMQGKFQLQVFPAAGHFVQEDLPENTAELIVEFCKRNDSSQLVLPPKVSDLLAQGKKV
ncbi:protein phosphatase methylesteras-like protein 1 [Aulographum hederae CBS 113979]|uniref:Protein phosphatase methylesterase 1 n=1 Tax=Aulographum hederae CBS 113979 TaxID=1176131 RepID=A0A6G1HGC6_9PEZI|nr:protein phosphatase methylesteras-like protein 1 [Aulographum hederae CBS 113979]